MKFINFFHPVSPSPRLPVSIARQIIIEKYGGKIEVNCTLGQGAEFVITIPVSLALLSVQD